MEIKSNNLMENRNAEEAGAELPPDDLGLVSGGANGPLRPCPYCGQELKWTAMAMEFVCFNKECPDYFYA